MKRLVCLTLMLAAAATAQRGPERAEAATGLLRNSPLATPGYTLISPIMSTTTYLVGLDGNVVHTWESEYPPGNVAYLLENGHLLRTASLGHQGSRTFHGGGSGGRVEEFTWDGTLVWSFELANDTALLHHDIERLPNGNVLMIAWELKTREDAIAAGRDAAAVGADGLWTDFLIEVKPTPPSGGEIVWEWHVWDHLIQDHDADKANFGYVGAHPERIDVNPIGWVEEVSTEDMEQLEALGYVTAPRGPQDQAQHADWNHTNAVAYNAELDQIALSIFGFNELWIIDHGTTTEEAAGPAGDLLYRWGNPRAYRAGSVKDQMLYKQHDVHWIAPGLPGAGHLLIFNNGMGRPDGTYSSILEIAPPVDESGHYARPKEGPFGPTAPLWQYASAPKESFYSMNISGAHRLASGNTLICSGVGGRVFEVTPEMETVWEYVVPGDMGGMGGIGGTPGPPGPRNGGGRPPLPRHLDQDKDGSLRYEEASALPFMTKEEFKRLDRDKDQKLAEDELPFPGPPGAMGPPPGAFAMGPPQGGLGGFPPSPPGMWPPMGGGFGPRPGGPGMRPPMGGGPGGGGTMVFRAYRYALDFPGLKGKSLIPMEQSGGDAELSARVYGQSSR